MTVPESGNPVPVVLQAPVAGRPELSAETVFRATLRNDEDSNGKSIPERIASFRVLSVLGEGGAGVVYCAEQDAPRRRVALKILKRVGPQSLRRFKHEADTLGKFRNRGIAQIYASGEAESSTGLVPFIAMELVDGVPITTYASDARLPLRKRLAFLLEVCDAVSYAHAQGVIHRDLKPSNILVTATGEVKVLDFGLALDTDAERSMATEAGQLMGTLAYMSPEQAQGGKLDSRTDVYALGVIGYELLAGRRPYDLPVGDPILAVRRIIETEPPSIASVDRSLRGDLDTILLKSLEKDPARRYATVAAMAADIRRYLEHQPIEARLPTLAYRSRKFIRRHKGLVVGTSAIVLTLIIGLIATTREAVVARREEGRAIRAEREANLNLTEALLSNGHAWLAAGKMDEARDAYLSAWNHLEALGESTLPAELGVWDIDRQHPRPIARWHAHSGSVTAVAVSEESGLAVTAGEDKILRVWDLRTLREIMRQDLPAKAMLVAMSQDGKWVALSDAAGKVALIKVATGSSIATWQNKWPSDSLAFSSDAKELAWSVSQSICIARTDLPTRPLVHHKNVGGTALISPVDKDWMCVGTDGDIVVLDGAQTTRSWKSIGNICGAAALDHGRQLAVTSRKEVVLYRIADGSEIKRLSISADSIFPIGGESGLMALPFGDALDAWEAGTGRKIWSLLPWGSGMSCQSVSGQTLCVGYSDGDVSFINASTEESIAPCEGHTSGVAAVAIAGGDTAVTGDNDGNVIWWDCRTRFPLARIKMPNGVISIAASQENKSAWVNTTDGRVFRWDLADPTHFSELPRLLSAGLEIVLAPDGHTLCGILGGSGAGPKVAFWAVEAGGSLGALGSTFTVDSTLESSHSVVWQTPEMADVIDGQGSLWQINIRTRETIRRFGITAPPAFLAAAPDEHWAALYSGGDLRVWDRLGNSQVNLKACTSAPAMLGYICSDRYIVTTDMAGHSRFCESQTGRHVGTIDLGIRNVLAAGVDSSGKWLVLADGQNRVVMADLSHPSAERELARRISGGIASETTPTALYQQWLRFRHPRLTGAR
jgi:WD40 repeat protein/predicted Ser/Thr protein kinase